MGDIILPFFFAARPALPATLGAARIKQSKEIMILPQRSSSSRYLSLQEEESDYRVIAALPVPVAEEGRNDLPQRFRGAPRSASAYRQRPAAASVHVHVYVYVWK